MLAKRTAALSFLFCLKVFLPANPALANMTPHTTPFDLTGSYRNSDRSSTLVISNSSKEKFKLEQSSTIGTDLGSCLFEFDEAQPERDDSSFRTIVFENGQVTFEQRAQETEAQAPNKPQCHYSIKWEKDSKPKKILVALSEDDCLSYCHADTYMFAGEFFRQLSECSVQTIKKRRAKAQKNFDTKNFPVAANLYESLLKECRLFIELIDLAWLHSDLALTYHRLGNDKKCRESIAEAQRVATDNLSESVLKDQGSSVVKAISTNKKMCASH